MKLKSLYPVLRLITISHFPHRAQANMSMVQLKHSFQGSLDTPLAARWTKLIKVLPIAEQCLSVISCMTWKFFAISYPCLLGKISATVLTSCQGFTVRAPVNIPAPMIVGDPRKPCAWEYQGIPGESDWENRSESNHNLPFPYPLHHCHHQSLNPLHLH